ncbi:winged helix-turn-helix domain-containing protein [Nitrobacter sp.]|uniref:winged helix-turn-helix domain-containing protein n=1 Tax=Nitrobacter sp. TaxID=29420 RepID=UPI00399D600C
MSIWLFFRIEFTRVNPKGCEKFGSLAGMGTGRVCILEAIDRYGSISAGAPAVGLKFQQFWRQVQDLNTQFKEPVVDIRRSGRNRGAFLTPLGKEVVRRYREMERITNKTLEKHYREFEALVGIDSTTPPFVPRWAQLIDPGTIAKPAKKRARTRQPVAKRTPGNKAKTRATKRATGRSR